MSIAFRDLPVYDLPGATRNFEQLVAFQFKGKALEGGLEEPSLVKEAGVGAWTNPEGFSSKLEETTTCQVRTESSKAAARIKGHVKTKEAIPGSTTIFTLPIGFRPTTQTKVWASDSNTSGVVYVTIEANGVVNFALEVAIAHTVFFDGITFNLT